MFICILWATNKLIKLDKRVIGTSDPQLGGQKLRWQSVL